jgi:hypothetical protein
MKFSTLPRNLAQVRIELAYQRQKRSERFWTFLAWKLPNKLAYWAYIRVAAHGSTGKYSTQVVPEMLMIEGLERWSKDKVYDR